ncbi:CheY-like chemotaxis protein [Nocardioides cavernae]|uniref:CheY-like chemotaxis protein n=1 Tax=Nocardioides cavernae TaxID=1921566 RepID=A0A7Y9H2N9_9ACTN|nr:response regulator [Nocardioides cavernae]NYE36831.1 CheY-like chemotaxis protein [Nocardioides cavernae]
MGMVLVVDDDDDIRDIVALVVRRRGFEVHSSADPVAALDVAAERGFTAAVLDWSMPEMNGGELCARLRDLPGLEQAPIVILTAYADAETRAQAYAAGATRFVTKPFSLTDLGDLLVGLVGAVPAEDGPAAPTS